MKIFNKLIILSVTAFFLFGCNNLDTVPLGDGITDEQKGDVVAGDASKLQADINALSANLITRGIADAAIHSDFGYAAACILWDASGADIVAGDVGYNWFRNPMKFRDRTDYSSETIFSWKLFYAQIKSANDILIFIPEGTTDKTFQYYKGQALVARAFSYLALVQQYQYTYLGHKDALAIPIVLETTSGQEAANNPRATVQAVYDLIMADLNQAVTLLDGFVRKGKDAANLNVAYGLRARANLLMGEWSAAVQDADKAMIGYSPYSLEDVSKPSFNTATSSSWIWANIITPDNAVTKSGVVNWPSHLCSLNGSGYAVQTGTWRLINKLIWNKIPSTDVRKGWWVDEQLKSPLTDEIVITEKEKDYSAAEYFEWDPYTNVKFGPYKDEILSTVNASDWPMMRVEEMIFIKAEGQAMAGKVSEAKSTLENFVKTYRNASYSTSAATAEELRDEIWFQRRVELWGEGFSFFDIMRLQKPMNRYDEVTGDTNFGSTSKFNLKSEHPIFLYRLPENETNTNAGITKEMNNPSIVPPTPNK